MLNVKRSTILWLTAAFAAALLVPLPALAVAPAAYTVPWVANIPTTPHDAWLTKTITFKGASDSQGANIQYSWDFGDGAFTPFAQVTDKYSIEAQHAYATGMPDATIYAATFTVKNTTTGELSTKPYFVKIRSKTLQTETDVAIDEGLWYLHKTINRTITCGTNNLPCGSWTAGFAADGRVSGAAANINAFEVNGHLENDPNGADNPYADDVARGLRWLLSSLSHQAVFPQTNPLGTFNPDSSGSGIGLYYNSSYAHYETGMIMDALVATGNPGGVASVSGVTNVSGRTYRAIVQDMLDWHSFCQTDNPPYGGSFYYTCNNGTVSDNSAAQWSAIGLIAAERAGVGWGLSIPQIVKDWNRSWLTYTQQPTTGIFGYQSASPAWGPYATTPSGMVQMVMDGVGRTSPSYSATCNVSGTAITRLATNPPGTPFNAPPTAAGYTIGLNGIGYFTIASTTDADHLTLTQSGGTANNLLCWFGPNWNLSETLMADNFGNLGGPASAPKAYMYGLFSFTKSMLLHSPPIQFLHSQTPGVQDLDWYAAETAANGGTDRTDGIARTLIGYQCAVGDLTCAQPGGYWNGPSYNSSQYPFTTAWAIIMLNKTIFTAGAPVAVATASPNPAVVGQTITLDGSRSFHQDPNKQIVNWQWDGITVPTFHATGPTATTTFGSIGDYLVRLTVTDNVGTTAQTIATVHVLVPPLAPTADAGGPYSFCTNNTPWFLDGTKSVSPTAGQHEPGPNPPNFIKAYAWNLNGGNTFTNPDATGPQPDVTSFFTSKGVGSYLIQLQVTDNSKLSYPSAPNTADLTGVASSQVTVRAATDLACAACISNLSAVAANNSVQLTWGLMSGATHYNVYRSNVSGGPYMLIGTAIAIQNMYSDTTVTNGTTYFYVVRPATLNGTESCQSNQVSVLARLQGCVAANSLTVTNYQFISQQVAAGTQSYLIYRADLVNSGTALGAVTATLTSLDPFTIRVVPGQGALNFAPVPANSQVTSSNTFTILADPTVPVDFNKLQWTFETTAAPPVAVAGPNQTVPVGTTVTLDGSGSTNPSCIGTLTYSWMFASRPPGTATRSFYTTGAIASFLADAPGDYVIQLTVSNGAASSSASVTVTAK